MTKLRFRNKDERELVKWARALGWEVAGRNGSNHLDLRHKKTGKCTRVPSKLKGGHIIQSAKSQLIAGTEEG
jgi:predicted RNA binding protein YcfA (HicA-like mRNA interferase family)